MYEPRETTRTVATLLDLAAIGIENAITKINVGLNGPFDQQQLVKTNAEMAISQTANHGGSQRNRLTNTVDNDKVVAQTMHLRETQLHRPNHSSSS